jgi:hypothetical protein
VVGELLAPYSWEGRLISTPGVNLAWEVDSCTLLLSCNPRQYATE